MPSLTCCVEAGGRRWYLDGRPIHCGEGLELRFPAGSWLRVRFEMTGDQSPVFYASLGGSHESWNPPPGVQVGDTIRVPCPDCGGVASSTCASCEDGTVAREVYPPEPPSICLSAFETTWMRADFRWPLR